MGRTRKGRAVSGWLLVDKPSGITSSAVVNKVKWAFEAAKVGHAGTLDPAATGVLAVALGEATKTVPYITDALKCYRFRVRFGQATNTDDAEGFVTSQSELRPTDTQIEGALAGFRGNIMQVPPQFSAVKIDGARAYDLAREGEVFDIQARPLWVESLTVIARPDVDHVDLEMVCGKGGYVRAIARDLGAQLGALGHVAWLRREWLGPFDAQNGISLAQIDALAKTPELDQYLQPLEIALANLTELPCSPEGAAKLKNGNPGMVLSSSAAYGDAAWASYQGRPVAVGIYKAGELHPSRVFNLD